MIVAVVEIGPVLADGVVVRIRASRRYGRLGDLGGTVHFVWHDQAMPMDGRRFRKVVREIDPDVISFRHLQPGPGNLTIVGVGIDRDVRQDVPTDDGGVDMEYFYAVFDAWF